MSRPSSVSRSAGARAGSAGEGFPFALVGPANFGVHNPRIDPGQRRERSERDGVAHDFPAKFFLRDTRQRNLIPANIRAPQVLRQRGRRRIENHEAARPQLVDVRRDGFKVEGDERIDGIGQAVVGFAARTDDVIRMTAANPRREVFVRIDRETAALENCGNRVARGKTAVTGLTTEHDLDAGLFQPNPHHFRRRSGIWPCV
jgi:hypothetical protein